MSCSTHAGDCVATRVNLKFVVQLSSTGDTLERSVHPLAPALHTSPHIYLGRKAVYTLTSSAIILYIINDKLYEMIMNLMV